MGSYRHALTVGFITDYLGYSLRTLPVFLGRQVHSVRLLNVSFALILLGCTIRVVFQALTVYVGNRAFAVAGMSGWIEATALSLYGFNLWHTLYSPASAQILPQQVIAKRSWVMRSRRIFQWLA